MQSDRSPRLLKFGVLMLAPALALGSCSGFVLSEFTISGMTPFHGSGASMPVAKSEPGDYGWPKLEPARASYTPVTEAAARDDSTY